MAATAQEMDLRALSKRFETRFGTRPRFFAAPGRINIIGEHTDYSEGFVMPAAIDRHCVVAAAPNNSNRLRIFAEKFGEEVEAELSELVPRRNWSDYVAGVAFVLRQAGIALPGLDLWIVSSVPVGAGVSSSAALEVSSAHAFLAFSGEARAGKVTTGNEIARWAQTAENRFVGMPCGIMDQFACANGVADTALMLDCRSLGVKLVALPPNVRFLLVDSMVRHSLVDGEYRSRRADCENAAKVLGVSALRDVALDDLADAERRLEGSMRKRCRHVVTENARVHAAAVAFEENNLDAVGALMNLSHASLRDDMEVSVEAVDRLAEIARGTEGVLGARMMGGGFGGCVIALVRAECAAAARDAILDAYGAISPKPPDGFLCRVVDGAGEVHP